jgi:putative redox protein
MEMTIDFPGGARVDAHFGPFTVMTDQPSASGNQGSAPTPFALFLASIGTCAGIYVLGFCNQRNLPTQGIMIVEKVHSNPMTGMVERIDLEIQVPPEFPDKYYPALVKSAEQCKVKQHMEKPPAWNIYTQVKNG